jgi:hypothetical protein
MDPARCSGFMATHARLLDRRRFELLHGGSPAAVLAALDGYRNPDGGYGHGLEPDLRSSESQPGGALHALEALREAGSGPTALPLLDWLTAASRPDGGIPVALPVTAPDGVAPFWRDADPAESSLQITACVLTNAYRLAAIDPEVAAHPWIEAATRYCLAAIEALTEAPHALVLSFALQLLEVVPDNRGLFKHLAQWVPADGKLAVAGGSEGETLHPVDVAPFPGPVRELFPADQFAADLDRYANGQQEDGGWTVGFGSFSPAAALEWRGYETVRAIQVLRGNGLA